MSDYYYAVIHYSAPLPFQVRVRRMRDDEAMCGIGWIVDSEHETLEAAQQAAADLRADLKP